MENSDDQGLFLKDRLFNEVIVQLSIASGSDLRLKYRYFQELLEFDENCFVNRSGYQNGNQL